MPKHQQGGRTKGAEDLSVAQTAAILAKRDSGVKYSDFCDRIGVSEEAARKLVSTTKKCLRDPEDLAEQLIDAGTNKKLKTCGRKPLFPPGSKLS